jgi:rhodanese-related sulfurtransferase
VERAKQDSNAIMIDVRTNEEHDNVHIPGSLVVDYLDKELADKIEALDSKKNYYVYCRTGRRSLRVCVIMRNLGFQNVYNLEDGIASMPLQ